MGRSFCHQRNLESATSSLCLMIKVVTCKQRIVSVIIVVVVILLVAVLVFHGRVVSSFCVLCAAESIILGVVEEIVVVIIVAAAAIRIPRKPCITQFILVGAKGIFVKAIEIVVVVGKLASFLRLSFIWLVSSSGGGGGGGGGRVEARFMAI
ncbi:hypothetical protein Ahy_A03g011517 isoform D [Arachis hypogaea]|uniref:Transmembrane protein n=1 Tax=Arachis hypogaea TaxID=3818 RepID=A0A445DQY9_ARAHY|nr:hypothetical protein Ahy_A03g011517 isoform D [Arachis hypogaea]